MENWVKSKFVVALFSLIFGIPTWISPVLARPQNLNPWKIDFDFSTSSGGILTRRTGRIFAVTKIGEKYFHMESPPIEIPFHGFRSVGLERDPFVLAHQIEEAVNSGKMTSEQLVSLFESLPTRGYPKELDDVEIPGIPKKPKFTLQKYKVNYGLTLSSGLNSPLAPRRPIERRGIASIRTQFLITGPNLVNEGHVFSSFEMTIPFLGARFRGQLVAAQIEKLLNEGKLSFHGVREALSHWELLENLKKGLTIEGIEIAKTPVEKIQVTFGAYVSSGVLGYEKNGAFVILRPNITHPQKPHFFDSFAIRVPFHGFKSQNPHVLAFALEDLLKEGELSQTELEDYLNDHNLGEKLDTGSLPGHLIKEDFKVSCKTEIKKIVD